jgi:hypothetical protein
MEHNMKTLLTQKIRATESEPITWNKQAVWTKVSNRITNKRSYRIYYYAAAVIILVLLGIRPLRDTMTQGTISETARNEEIQQPFKPEPILPGEMQIAEKVVQGIKPSQEVNKLAVQIHSDVVPAVPTSELIQQAGEDIIEVQSELNINESIVIMDDVVEQTIQPIVGVVEWSEQNVVAEKVKKKRLLRKLETSDKEWDDSAESNDILFARIK